MEIKTELQNVLQQPTIVFSDELLVKMLTYIGHPDSELRDSIICNLFYAGIPTGEISVKQQQWLLDQILDKQLIMTGINEVTGDRVFTRTFSLLVLALIIAEDSKSQFISEVQLALIFRLANTYLRTEQDTRGYVESKGWAHGVAHGADLLVSIVSHPSFTQAMIPEIQQTIECVLFRKTEPFMADEEGRLCQIIVTQLVKYPQSADYLVLWLKEMLVRLAVKQNEEDPFETYQFERKIFQFIEALYFRLVISNKPEISEQLLTLILSKHKGG
ncbi:DUF2785 domain-containing protein [Vagococcus sp. BWB3-3]|uniref:DUF2785 domain-containing protein n=1 Tax=Vagococcus allomyrinae TaxID=2794353 RepID=A0A940PFD9_9ENTE|nr:DUF2785 domain-containing protein [Vagococcus allomyrinae]MBP1043840.1 DUF2785 domain-containing protein [Vagococcus allomyrinae]